MVPCSVDLWFGSRVPSSASIVEHFATLTMAGGEPHTEFFRKSKTGLAISPFAMTSVEMIYMVYEVSEMSKKRVLSVSFWAGRAGIL